MHSIKTKITLLTVGVIIVALGIATTISVVSVKDLGRKDADQLLQLMCTTGTMNLEAYFTSVENSVNTVSTLVKNSLEKVSLKELDSQVERARPLFENVAYNTNGVLTYYFRIDPEVSKTAKGFWYVNLDGKGFKEHEVTDITQYDTNDTSALVWFTVPKATGKGVWLPPYITDNLDVKVISYNEPVYWKNTFVGVIGIEIDYKTLAHEVENIKLYDNGYAFILDEDSNIIYHPREESSDEGENAAVSSPKKIIGNNHIQYTYNGVEKEAVWMPLSNGMRLYVTVPLSEVNSGWQNLIWRILFASLIILMIVSFVMMNFANRITRPLTDITEAAKQIDKGNYDVKVDYYKDDEVGILTHTLMMLAAHTKSHISDLNKQVYVDALTSVRNKGGYAEFINELEDEMDKSEKPIEFAIGVFDCDDLKSINDTYGHDKGDIYLKSASRLICRIFQHSPVFRIGGDEFSVVLRNDDFRNREDLVVRFREEREKINEAVSNEWEQVNVTMGLAVYDPDHDGCVIDVSRRADKLMYENKQARKKKA